MMIYADCKYLTEKKKFLFCLKNDSAIFECDNCNKYKPLDITNLPNNA